VERHLAGLEHDVDRRGFVEGVRHELERQAEARGAVQPVRTPGQLGEEARVPQGEVGTDQLLDHVQDLGRARDREKRGVVRQQRGAVVAKLRMSRDEPLVRTAELLEQLFAESEVGHDEAVALVALDLLVRQRAAG